MHHLRTLTIVAAALALPLASGGCKKKAADAKSGSGSSSASGASAASGAPAGSTGAPSTTSSAAGGDLSGLKPVSDCPKSLSGHDDALDRTIKKECGTVAVSGQYSIDGKLTIEGGVTLAFQPGAQMDVGYQKTSKLIVQGTAAAPVTFTIAGDKVAGNWKGVRLYENAARSSIDGLVIEFAGNDKGALTIDAKSVTVKNTTVRDATEFGIYVQENASIVDATGLAFERAGKVPLSLPASSVGALGAGSTFKDAGSFVQVRAGRVTESATWQNPGTFYQLEGDIDVDGQNASAKVTVQAGTELRFDHDAQLYAGYNQPGVIDLEGTADKPVVVRAVNDGKDQWKGLGVYEHGELDLEHVAVSGANQDQDLGAIWSKGGILSIKDSKLSGDTLGITARDRSKLKALSGTTFDGVDKAWVLDAELIGAIAADNVYGKGTIGEIVGGHVAHDATWQPQAGLDEHVKDELDVNGAKLTLAPGTQLMFDDVKMSVGYTGASALFAEGTADKPIVLRGVRDDKGAWPGLIVYESATDVRLANLTLANPSADVAIDVKGATHVDAQNVTFQNAAAGVQYGCKAKVTTTGVKMDGGGTAEKKPDKC